MEETPNTPVSTGTPVVEEVPVIAEPVPVTPTVESKVTSDVKSPVRSVVDTATKEPYVNARRLDIEDDRTSKSVLMPTASATVIDKLIGLVDSIQAVDVTKTLSQEELTTIAFNYQSLDKTIKNGVTTDVINEEDFVNSVVCKDKSLGIVPVNVNAKGKLSGTSALAKFTAKLGIGKHTTVTLWHSGFSVVLAPPKESDIINLQYTIAKSEHELGLSTNNFIYSNYGVVINKHLVDFILAHIIASSLTLPEDSRYTDYIKLTDLNTLAIGMATSMRPNGHPVTVTCRNSCTLVDNHPACDYTATAEVIPTRLLWVNRKLLTTETLAHISKTSPGSHTVKEVLAYQNSISVNDTHTINVCNSAGDLIDFVIRTPCLADYIDAGELWVNTVIANAEELFTDDDTQDNKNSKIDTLVLASILNKYNSYVTNVKLDDAYVDDPATISDILEVMSSDGKLCNELLKGIVDHIDRNYISIVATYNYECPTCKAAGRDGNQTDGEIKGFREFIPLNAVEHFFDLSTLKFTQVVNRKR